MQCAYYRNLNGPQGECTVEPPIPVKDRWSYPVVERDCHCRFHCLELPAIEIIQSESEIKDLMDFLSKHKDSIQLSYAKDEPEQEPEDEPEDEKALMTDKKQTARQKLLAKKKAGQLQAKKSTE